MRTSTIPLPCPLNQCKPILIYNWSFFVPSIDQCRRLINLHTPFAFIFFVIFIPAFTVTIFILLTFDFLYLQSLPLNCPLLFLPKLHALFDGLLATTLRLLPELD